MKSDFILKIGEILKYEDFQDIQIAGLESLRNDEKDYLIKLFAQDRLSALIYSTYLINQFLKIESDILPKLKQSIQEIHQQIRLPGRSLLFIEQSEEEINLRAEFLYNISDYITDIFEVLILFAPKLFKQPELTSMMKKYVRPHNEVLQVSEQYLSKPKGRPFEPEETLYDHLTEPDRSEHLRLILNEYSSESPVNTYFMVVCLRDKSIISKKIFSTSTSFVRILQNTFKNLKAGNRANIYKFYDRYDDFINPNLQNKSFVSDSKKELKYRQNIECQSINIDRILMNK